MRRLLIFLLLACPAFGTIAFSHSGVNSAASGAVTATVTISAGETAVVLVDLHAAAVRTVSSVVDSTGTNTYTQQASINNANTSQTYIWTSPNVANAATTATVTMSGTYTILNVIVLTYTGVNAIGTSATNSASSTAPSVSLTTQDANNFVVAVLGQTAGSATVTFTANAGTIRLQQTAADNMRIGAGLDNTAASASSVTNSVTSNKTAAWSACAVELRSTAGGSPTFVPSGGFLVQ